MFLLEAIPTILLGLAVLRFLPDRPDDVTWLTRIEKVWLGSRLAAEAKEHGMHSHSLRQALLMPRVWRYGLVYFCVLVGLYGFSFWLPQIIASLGTLTNVQVGAISTIPYALACVALVLWGRHSDATGDAALPAFWALASRGLQGAAAAGAIALINSLGNIGGFLGPTAIGFVKERTGSYAMSLMPIALCLAVGAGIVLWERAREQRTVALLSEVSP